MQGTETAFKWALLFYFHFHFWDSRSHGLYGAAVPYIYKIGCFSVVLSICKLFAIFLSVTSPYCVCGKWTSMYCNKLLASGICPFSAAVLNSSPRVPPLCTFCTFLLSLQMFVLFHCKCPAKWTSHHRIFRHDSSSKRTFVFHSKGIEVCETWIYIVFIYRGILCYTSRFFSKFRLSVKTLRSVNSWMNVPKWSKLQRISPAQGVGSNVHCVGTM